MKDCIVKAGYVKCNKYFCLHFWNGATGAPA